ncbi:sigma-70 family RNA polymerase sigma factor [Lacticaseibacillus kribbianus]|uniref:sigma-70 family RNA polymerase sigma factor n=1 Tax=Lacticaseibacillus kribbianus TaxID=2926292 RepID=UPI001CD69FDB|nr:sigma-70 family RNA polymerase sigma factor [Lacticaseibacillus kribbianus]
MNEAELARIDRAQTDSEAFETLFNQYRPMVLRQISRFYLRDFDRDDWLQEARIAMLKALQKFDGGQGSQFGPYFRLVLQSHYNSLLRLHLALKRRAEEQAINVFEVREDVSPYHLSAQEVETDFLVWLESDRFWDSLSPSERHALQANLAGRPDATDHHVARALERAHRKLERYLADQHEG